jgi:predicted ester cyclase
MKISDLQKNKTVVQRYVDEIQNDHSIDAIESIFSGEFIDHMDTYGGLFQGIDGLKKGYTAAFQAFPDLKAIVRQMIAEEDMVVLWERIEGSFGGFQPPAKKLSTRVFTYFASKIIRSRNIGVYRMN